MPKQFKTVEFEDRKKIATMYAAGAIAADIARQIGVSATTIYAELKRGQDGVTLDKNFRPAYDPDLAQKRVQEMCPIRLKLVGASRRASNASERRDAARRILGF